MNSRVIDDEWNGRDLEGRGCGLIKVLSHHLHKGC
jgi:hypothetical protein